MKFFFVSYCMVFFVLTFVSGVNAEDNPLKAIKDNNNPILSSSDIVYGQNFTNENPAIDHGQTAKKIILSLLFVCSFIFILAWISKKFGMSSYQNNEKIKLVSSMSMGTKEKICLFEVEGEKILLGVTAQSINTLKVYSKEISDLSLNDVDSVDKKNTHNESVGNLSFGNGYFNNLYSDKYCKRNFSGIINKCIHKGMS